MGEEKSVASLRCWGTVGQGPHVLRRGKGTTERSAPSPCSPRRGPRPGSPRLRAAAGRLRETRSAVLFQALFLAALSSSFPVVL